MRLIASTLILAVATIPAAAHTLRHRGHAHRVMRSAEAGMPITAEPDSIRINAVGQVISQPVPMIQKERKFDSKARQDLSKSPQETVPSPANPPQP